MILFFSPSLFVHVEMNGVAKYIYIYINIHLSVTGMKKSLHFYGKEKAVGGCRIFSSSLLCTFFGGRLELFLHSDS